MDCQCNERRINHEAGLRFVPTLFSVTLLPLYLMVYSHVSNILSLQSRFNLTLVDRGLRKPLSTHNHPLLNHEALLSKVMGTIPLSHTHTELDVALNSAILFIT